MHTDRVETPLADRLGTLLEDPPCYDFHAVPWSGLLCNLPPDLAVRYDRLLGARFAEVDRSWVGGAVDSFFAPQGPLAAAQAAAARAFGADQSFFGTLGTTLSNRVVLEALCPPGSSLLLDPAAHQSLVFAAEGRDVIRMPCVAGSDPLRLDVVETVRLLVERVQMGEPVAVLALSACAYDGRQLRLEHVLPMLIEASPTTTVIVDEAWSAIHGFDPETTATTALSVARKLPRQAPVVVTQSAHKTMGALRQGSYIHLLGEPAVAARISEALYRNHSTSPSWPILASLDLARAHAERCGAEALATARRIRTRLLREIEDDPLMRGFLLSPPRDAFHSMDPLVVHLHSPGSPSAVQAWLFARHRVLLAQSRDRLVARIHIGVRDDDVEALLAGLRDLAARAPEIGDHLQPMPAVVALADLPHPGAPCSEYFIAYPPGVPLAHPGDPWSAEIVARLFREQARGAEIHRLRPTLPPVPQRPRLLTSPAKSGADL